MIDMRAVLLHSCMTYRILTRTVQPITLPLFWQLRSMEGSASMADLGIRILIPPSLQAAAADISWQALTSSASLLQMMVFVPALHGNT